VAGRAVSADLPASVKYFEVAATASGDRIEITMTITLEIDDVQALDMVLKLVEAIAAARGEDRP
jgi:hypothetical protein